MRTLAWWQTTPDQPSGKDAPKKGPRIEPLSRIAERREKEPDFRPDLPEFDAELRYLIDALLEAGPTSRAGMGGGQLSWADLAAWEGGTGIELRPWESRVLRALSLDYLVEADKARKPGCACPYTAAGGAAAPIGRNAQATKDAIRALARLNS